VVRDSGYDAVLFAGLAILLACLFNGKFSSLWVLITGEAGHGCVMHIHTFARGRRAGSRGNVRAYSCTNLCVVAASPKGINRN
jgi:hypothetical protein